MASLAPPAPRALPPRRANWCDVWSRLPPLCFHLGSVTQARFLAVFNNAEIWARWEPLATLSPLADLYNLISLMGHAVQDLFPTDQRENKQGNIPPGFLRSAPTGAAAGLVMLLENFLLINSHQPPVLDSFWDALTPGSSQFSQPLPALHGGLSRSGAPVASDPRWHCCQRGWVGGFPIGIDFLTRDPSRNIPF